MEVELHSFLILVLCEGMYSQSAALMKCFSHRKSPVPIGEEARMISRDGMNVREEEKKTLSRNPHLPPQNKTLDSPTSRE